MSDLWLIEQNKLEDFGRQIAILLKERDQHTSSSATYSKKNAEVAVQLKSFCLDLQKLRDDFIRKGTRTYITQGESERRQRLLDQLNSTEKRLSFVLTGARDCDRSFLLDSPSGNTNPFASDDMYQPGRSDATTDKRTMDVNEFRQHQESVVRDQDAGLDVLAGVIQRQKQMAMDIGNEVDTQNELVDDLTSLVQNTDSRVRKEERHIRVVDRKASGTCGLWVTIVLLLIAIVVIAVIPYHGKA